MTHDLILDYIKRKLGTPWSLSLQEVMPCEPSVATRLLEWLKNQEAAHWKQVQ